MKKIKEDSSGDDESVEFPKLKKTETFSVEGTNWKVGVTIDTTEFDSVDDILIESATRGAEHAYRASPKDFKLGGYVQIVVHRKKPYLKWVNSHTILINSSLYNLADTLKKNFLESQKIDIEKEKRVI